MTQEQQAPIAEPTINLELPVKATQFIIDLLNERPHKDVRDLIDSIVTQANAQLNPPPPKETQGDTDGSQETH